VGQGTTFKVYLPVVESAAAAAAAEAEPEMVGGTGTILLVEDGDALRAMMRELLEGSGYTVIEAETPRAALGLLDTHQGSLDLLLTDVVMPGMRGPDLADRIRERRPDLRVLFMSGYTDETVTAQGLVARGAHFVQKPFSAAALLAQVGAALGT
jgi:two-component system, cell cycle sensor histidine kinase and response regulator CckA